MMEVIFNRMPWAASAESNHEPLLNREWIVTNGLGGYASGSVSGACTRRYHGLLIAALPAPLGRLVMFNHLAEELRLPSGQYVQLGAAELPGGVAELPGAASLIEFRLEHGLPVWRYALGDTVLEKRILLPYGQNTVHINYRLVEGTAPLRLGLRPSVHFRAHEASVASSAPRGYHVTVEDERVEIHTAGMPSLRLQLMADDAAVVLQKARLRDLFYRVEAARGYSEHGALWSPGYFRATLRPGESVTLIGSTEDWATALAIGSQEALDAQHQRSARLLAQAHPAARSGMAGELVLAADQFIITPTTRQADAVRAKAAGDEVRTVIAGYHWFTDWGRDTMISLEGLTLTTGRWLEAGYILRTFGHHVRDGLIPNLFPEGENEGLYHTADATLWFFHAIDRYLQATGDRDTLNQLLPTLREIVAHHLRGTKFGIRVDPQDGLLMQGEAGYQLTWMDAKVDGWVVTPRRGKAVEINALWYNALRLLARWVEESEQGSANGEDNGAASAGAAADRGGLLNSEELLVHADRARRSFNDRFWKADRGYLLDVIDGETGSEDPAFRPNQVFAISLAHPVLEESRWQSVIDQVVDRLLTPVGLRSLAPGHVDYKPRYDGDLRARDAAYHQGTVWSWLIGPFIDAWLKVYPDRAETARDFLQGFRAHLGEACIGSVSEVFDAEAPYTPRGCIAQAWGVAEVLRAWVKLAESENLGSDAAEPALSASNR